MAQFKMPFQFSVWFSLPPSQMAVPFSLGHVDNCRFFSPRKGSTFSRMQTLGEGGFGNGFVCFSEPRELKPNQASKVSINFLLILGQ